MHIFGVFRLDKTFQSELWSHNDDPYYKLKINISIRDGREKIGASNDVDVSGKLKSTKRSGQPSK